MNSYDLRHDVVIPILTHNEYVPNHLNVDVGIHSELATSLQVMTATKNVEGGLCSILEGVSRLGLQPQIVDVDIHSDALVTQLEPNQPESPLALQNSFDKLFEEFEEDKGDATSQAQITPDCDNIRVNQSNEDIAAIVQYCTKDLRLELHNSFASLDVVNFVDLREALFNELENMDASSDMQKSVHDAPIVTPLEDVDLAPVPMP